MSEEKLNIEELRKGGVVKLKEKDMFSIWVRAVCNNLDARKLRRVADLADKYGKGIILFSTRQIPIIPHIHFKDVGSVKKELGKVYLMLDRCGARVRNTDVCYDANICPYATLDPIGLAEKLDQFWEEDQGGFKIKTSVVGCEKQCTAPRALADIGFVGVERDSKKGYDAYAGGKLGLDPSVGIKIAKLLSEEECLKFVKNYVEFIRKEGRDGERSAALIRRFGENVVREKLIYNIKEGYVTKPIKCDTKQEVKTDKSIVRIRATNGEVLSHQVRKIADIAENYGFGFVHFPVRGGPEIPGIDKEKIENIRQELKESGLSLIDRGVDNLQSCFGGYCTNGNLNTQPFIREVEKIVERLDLDNRSIKISASGCPNACGVSYLSDIGFIGVVEPEVVEEECTGCEVCVEACRVNSIEIEDNLAIIDLNKCKNCDMCVRACPFDAIHKKREGIAVYVGGRGTYFMDDSHPGETKLAKKLIDFINEEKALQITENILKLVKENGSHVDELVDKMGFEKFKGNVL